MSDRMAEVHKLLVYSPSWSPQTLVQNARVLLVSELYERHTIFSLPHLTWFQVTLVNFSSISWLWVSRTWLFHLHSSKSQNLYWLASNHFKIQD